jgi:hypothetical protein
MFYDRVEVSADGTFDCDTSGCSCGRIEALPDSERRPAGRPTTSRQRPTLDAAQARQAYMERTARAHRERR